MRRLRYLNQAIRDIREIAQYIEAESSSNETAFRFTEKLRAQCRRLAELPGQLGTPRDDLSDYVRSFPIGSHIIFFMYEDDVLSVVRVVEGHRDIGRLFVNE